MQDPTDIPAPLPSPGPREFVHKLNNQLTVMLAHAEAAVASGDPAEMRRALELIVATTASVASMARSFAKACAPQGAQRAAGRRESAA